MKSAGLEELRELFADDRLMMSLALVNDIDLLDDRSLLYVTVTLVPDEIEIVAKMSWDAVGPDAGDFQFPSKNDLVIVGFMDGHQDNAYVLRRLTSQEDKIPVQAVSGDKVSRALAGKKNHLLSDTEVLLGRGGDDPTEPLVLGHVFQTAYSEHLDIDSRHQHIGNMGYNTFVPNEEAEYKAVKASPVDDSAMLSDLSKTEK